jgi:hypothetical protein
MLQHAVISRVLLFRKPAKSHRDTGLCENKVLNFMLESIQLCL